MDSGTRAREPPAFLTIPLEIRKRVYANLFGFHRAELQVQPIPPMRLAYFDYCCRSSQILRVCKQIWEEAHRMLMENTLVVAPMGSPLPLEYGFGGDADSAIQSSIQHLEYRIAPNAVTSGT